MIKSRVANSKSVSAHRGEVRVAARASSNRGDLRSSSPADEAEAVRGRRAVLVDSAALLRRRPRFPRSLTTDARA